MAFHLPYSQRQKHPPVYIGFETPPAYIGRAGLAWCRQVRPAERTGRQPAGIRQR